MGSRLPEDQVGAGEGSFGDEVACDFVFSTSFLAPARPRCDGRVVTYLLG